MGCSKLLAAGTDCELLHALPVSVSLRFLFFVHSFRHRSMTNTHLGGALDFYSFSIYVYGYTMFVFLVVHVSGYLHPSLYRYVTLSLLLLQSIYITHMYTYICIYKIFVDRNVHTTVSTSTYVCIDIYAYPSTPLQTCSMF